MDGGVDSRSRTGRTGEDIAAEYLAAKGMKLIAKNFRTKGGEIDLIMRDGDFLVFVEVKTRVYATQQSAFDAISRAKRTRISKTAVAYLNEIAAFESPCRFDVVVIVGALPDVRIEHYRNAFEFAARNYFI